MKEQLVQQSNETQVSLEKREEKDYLYINMWLLLMLIGIITFIVISAFPRLFDSNTLMSLLLLSFAITYGSLVCVRLAMKKHAKQTLILTFFCFFISLVSVAIWVIDINDNKKITAILSLLFTIPISFFSILPNFYYGDRRENDPEIQKQTDLH